jgi:molecular chaperone DnaK
LPRKPNVFALDARAEDGSRVAVEPATLTIVQGLTISDPPLSRTIGVALASDHVRVYFERGAPLPARRTFVHHTVESVAKGSDGCVLKIPIVQGELAEAHLCRLVGSLEISGATVQGSLPAGSPVELTLELDRGGRLSARALVPALSQVFEEVAHLLVPEAAPEVLEANVRAMRDRLAALRTAAFRRGDSKTVDQLGGAEKQLAEAQSDVAAARGGDADAAQKARRTLIELDALLEECEFSERWPELEEQAREKMASAASWVSEHGTPAEQKLLAEAAQAVEKARAERKPLELQRQLRVVSNLTNAAFYRDPEAWRWAFEHAASEVSSASDLPRAESLVRQGRQALENGETSSLRGIVEQLWRLLPADAQSRRLGYDSGVR